MTPLDQFGAKPAVLRCSRCGKFVDWDEAQVQVVCSCRPRIDLPPVLVREATDSDRAAARELFARDFGRTHIVALGDALHIVALATDPMWQRSGVGGHLVAEAELLARRLGLKRLIVSTTNDNLPALYFYQRRGYRLTDLVPNSIIAQTGQEVAGFAGIPVRDEVRLEKRIG